MLFTGSFRLLIALGVHGECYNIVTNQCQTFARELFKQMKARQVLDEASQLVGRNLDSVARVLYEGSSDTLVAREEPVALGTEKHSYEHDVPSAVQFY
jgi:hypothetical protein